MMKHVKTCVFPILTLVVIVSLQFCTCSPSQPVAPNERITAVISATISGPVYQGSYYTGFKPATDYVFWIATKEGDYIKTLKISKGAVNVASTGIHAEHLPEWQEYTGVESDEKVEHDSLSYIFPAFDGLTSASLRLDGETDTTITLTWDFTDTAGNPVPDDEYYFCVETANLIKNGTPPEYVPAEINSEMCHAEVITRRRLIKKTTDTKHIKNLTVSILPLGSAPSLPTDGVTSATH